MKLEIWPGPRIASLGRHKQFLAGHKNFAPPNSRVRTKNKKKRSSPQNLRKIGSCSRFLGWRPKKKKKKKKRKEKNGSCSRMLGWWSVKLQKLNNYWNTILWQNYHQFNLKFRFSHPQKRIFWRTKQLSAVSMGLRIDFCIFRYWRLPSRGDYWYLINGQSDFKKITYIACAILYKWSISILCIFSYLGYLHLLKYNGTIL